MRDVNSGVSKNPPLCIHKEAKGKRDVIHILISVRDNSPIDVLALCDRHVRLAQYLR